MVQHADEGESSCHNEKNSAYEKSRKSFPNMEKDHKSGDDKQYGNAQSANKLPCFLGNHALERCKSLGCFVFFFFFPVIVCPQS